MSTARYCTLHLSLSLRDSKSTNKFKSIAQKLFAPIKEDFLQNQISPRGDEENSCSPEELEKNKNKNKKTPNNKRKINSHRQQKQTLFRSSGVSDLAMASKSGRKKKHKRPPKQTQILDLSTHLREFPKNSSQEMGGMPK
jgi:hypothetical protein